MGTSSVNRLRCHAFKRNISGVSTAVKSDSDLTTTLVPYAHIASILSLFWCYFVISAFDESSKTLRRHIVKRVHDYIVPMRNEQEMRQDAT